MSFKNIKIGIVSFLLIATALGLIFLLSKIIRNCYEEDYPVNFDQPLKTCIWIWENPPEYMHKVE